MLRAWPLQGDSSARTTALEIALPHRRRRFAVLRQRRGAGREARLLAVLRTCGLPVPAPLHAGRAGTAAPYAATALVTGRPEYDPENREAAALQMAAFLARLHRRGHAARFPFLPRLGPPRRLAGPGRALPSALRPARALLEAAAAPAAAHGQRLLHGDFWPGNLLWQDGRLAAVVDWEDAATGDPLADLAIARCDLCWSFGFHAMALFTRRYAALTGFDLASLPLWDMAAVVRQAPHAADWAEGWRALGRGDITADSVRAAHRRLAQEAMAVLGGTSDSREAWQSP